MVKSHPSIDGCWYCYDNENTEANPLYFSREFDTMIHLNCIKKRLKEHREKNKTFEDDFEIEIFETEFKELLNVN